MLKPISALAVLLFTFNAMSQTPTLQVVNPVKKIEVTGTAEIEITPDEIYVDVTIQEYYGKNKQKVDIDDVRKSFLDACVKAGIDKENIFINGINGYDPNQWYWIRKKKKEPDFMATSTFTIKCASSAQVEKLISYLDDQGTQNLNVSRTSHSKMETFKKDLKVKALQAAKTKAAYLCESIGERAGKAILIRENTSQVYTPQPMYKMEMANVMMQSADGAPTPSGLDFQKIKLSSEIYAEFTIE